MTFRSITLLICLSLLRIDIGAAEAGKVELYVLQTTTLTDEQFLTGVREGQPATIAAELRLPVEARVGRVPAVVIAHGSAGIIGAEDRWSRELNDMGIATLILDGFTGRGIVSTGQNQAQLGNLTMINDAFRALELIAKDPRIDATRIGILGGSRGGRIALYASLKRFHGMYAAPGTEFAVYLPFYAPCYTTYIDDADVVDRPIRLFHGTADDYVTVGPCRSYVERLRQAGRDVQLTEYAEAHHGFDNPVTPVTRFPQNQTARGCTLVEDSLGHIVNRDTSRDFTWDDACVERGVTAGYNAHAHAEAIEDVKSVLRQVFRLDAARD